MQLIALAAIGSLAAGMLAGCAETKAPPAAPEVADCDLEDRRKKEVPDCGFRHRRKYYEWSWVKQGATTPPAGWSADAEKKKIIG
jgi:hypothetical protein